MSMWMVERQFKLGDDHPTHPGYVTPVRSVVEADTEEQAQANANTAAQEALAQLGGLDKGEWVRDAEVLYELGDGEAVEGEEDNEEE